MQFNIEKTISNFVESQFPQFYLDEGPNFVLFVKAYYEWMESEGQATQQARSLFDIRDIDNTLTSFLEHFQTKYLYGIPFNVIVNKRFLLKHIYDVYRSKGSISCYKLLFKLIYNQDVEVYLPGQDILKPSDGTWVEPQYLEITNVANLQNFIGQTIVGLTSNTSAIVESCITEPFNQKIIASMYISNVLPTGGAFTKGEKVVIQNQISNTAAVIAAPVVYGSLNSIQIINGGQGFKVGDTIKIVHRNLTDNSIVSNGVGGLLRVTGITSGVGQLYFNLIGSGFGYTSKANTYLYRGTNDTTGTGASFSIGQYAYSQPIKYNTDLIVDYANTYINATSYGFLLSTVANSASTISSALTYTTDTFSSIVSLTNIVTGSGYTNNGFVFVRSTQSSKTKLPGTISYTSSSNTLTLSGTFKDSVTSANGFPAYFSNGDVISLQGNSTNNLTFETQVIKSVDSNTQITLYGPPTYNSTSTAIYKTAPVTLSSNFALYEPTMFSANGSINGQNENITATPASGNNIIANTAVINSGKGYVDGEIVSAYLSGGLNTITIVNPGVGYTNNDTIIFSSSDVLSIRTANGFVTTDNNGMIVSAVYDTDNGSGSGYASIPVLSVKSNTGSNAVLTTSLTEFNKYSQVTGKVVISGSGKQQGYWSTTKGFLDSDKYIQDSYFYQDYSYQIRTAVTLNKYKDILYNTFHVAGNELFGQYYQLIEESAPLTIGIDSSNTVIGTNITVDSIVVTDDSGKINADQTYTY